MGTNHLWKSLKMVGSVIGLSLPTSQVSLVLGISVKFGLQPMSGTTVLFETKATRFILCHGRPLSAIPPPSLTHTHSASHGRPRSQLCPQNGKPGHAQNLAAHHKNGNPFLSPSSKRSSFRFPRTRRNLKQNPSIRDAFWKKTDPVGLLTPVAFPHTPAPCGAEFAAADSEGWAAWSSLPRWPLSVSKRWPSQNWCSLAGRKKNGAQKNLNQQGFPQIMVCLFHCLWVFCSAAQARTPFLGSPC